MAAWWLSSALLRDMAARFGLGPAAPLSQAGVTKDYYGAYPRIFMIPLPFYCATRENSKELRNCMYQKILLSEAL